MDVLSNQLFSLMGEQAEDIYLIFDIKARTLIYQNPPARKILGELKYSHFNDLEPLWNLVHPDDQTHLEKRLRSLNKGDFEKINFRLVIDGKAHHVRSSLALVEAMEKLIACVIIEDFTISEENKIHIEMINARKNVTLEVLSHDIKEPLGMIKMIASSIEKNLKDEDEYVKSSLSFIQEMCERNLTLIRSMVNHEFLKSSAVAIDLKRSDLVWEIQDVIRFYKRSHLSKSRNFIFSSNYEKIYLNVDSIKLMQVVNNLISNSIKFTNFGGQIHVDIEDMGHLVQISVRDDGIGIPENLQSRIFEADKDAMRAGLEGQPSGGLGLGIVKKIVELHQGKIFFESKSGSGTSFFIQLPKNIQYN